MSRQNLLLKWYLTPEVANHSHFQRTGIHGVAAVRRYNSTVSGPIWNCSTLQKARRRKQVSVRASSENRRAPVAIIAPHGGSIEPGTSEIAATIAGDSQSFYAFEALRPAGVRGS